MTVYFLTVGNIHNDDTELIKGASLDECYDKAADAAEEMLNNIKKMYENDEAYNVDAFTIKEDITYTEDVHDAYEYFNNFE